MTKPKKDKYELGLDKNDANYSELSPLTFIERAATVFPKRTSLIHGSRRYKWEETFERTRLLSSALRKRGIEKGDTVAVIAPNIPEHFEAHFGVPAAGGVLNSINIRQDAENIAFILEHGEAKALITDREYSDVIRKALHMLDYKPLVIDIDDPEAGQGELIGETTYDEFLKTGDGNFKWEGPEDEWDAISLNYTSGTTGIPKGVVYHHRGAYLNALGNIIAWGMTGHPVYLWTLPMFHCNGWCFAWSLAALAGTSVCLRRFDARKIFGSIAEHGVTHLCGAPVVMNMIINSKEEERRKFSYLVNFMTAAAAPPAAVLERIEKMGFAVTHVYGLTETYGPAAICEWHGEWDELPPEERAQMKARQGVRYTLQEGLTIGDTETSEPVPADAKTIGEALFRGNIVMKGYLKNPTATDEAFAGGWFHTGDLGVMHSDGYIELKDRSKDIIISGGENISTLEVESVLYQHPEVLEAAVVARPDEEWGETPCAFVTLKPASREIYEQDIIEFCRSRLAHFKCPKTVFFMELPKTSTGKIQKYVLRDIVKKL
ncbi:MAG: acyl-CoA synthetase [Thermodesulfobacteriota bacterium]